MMNLIQFELIKIFKNRTVLGSIVVASFLLFGIFYVRYYQSQNNFAARELVTKGYPTRIDKLVEKKYSGEFTDEKVQLVVSDFMDLFQDNIDIKNEWYDGPFYPFYWEITDAFVSRKTFDIYVRMINKVKAGERMSVEEVPIVTLADKGFNFFEKDLKIGNYGPWTDLYKASGDLYVLIAILVTFASSLIFADDTSKNMNQLLLSTKYGRGQLISSKLLAGILATIGLFAFVHLINFVVFMAMNDISGWKSSIQINFTMKLYDFPMYWNHLQIYFWFLVLQLLGIFFIASSSFLVSALVKSPLSAFTTAVGVYLLPILVIQAFKTSPVALFFNFFPINQNNLNHLLDLLSHQNGLFFSTFIGNTALLYFFFIMGTVLLNLLAYSRMKNWTFK
ncbi:ABC transporter permease subunit [Streptococcus ovis]|uniref:ABC transporter permease subunit n=1 Tax=Streptococcus ovis TaxID=82806 RepID=UPI0003769504|nr:ABC transporter permease subunit [Streptococcus ovis]